MQPSHQQTTRNSSWLTLLAAAFALGIVIGLHQPQPMVWPWLIAAAAAAAGGFTLRRRQARFALACTVAAMVAFGAAWVALKHHYVHGDDLAAWLGDEAVLVHVEGVATSAPELRRRTGGSLAVFDYRAPATYFPMRVDGLFTRDQNRIEVSGRVYVRVDDAVAPFRAGDRVNVTGYLVPIQPPRNPGEFDAQAYARSLGQAGMLTVTDRRLLSVTPAERNRAASAWLDFRDTLQRRAGGSLISSLPETDLPHRDALLKALLLGQREPELDGVAESFQRVGLAHLMAISGLHLGILAGMVLLLVRLTGHYRPWHGWLVIAVVLGYLTLVEVRLPVLRAGVMTIAACLGLVLGRTLHVGGLVALSGIGLLLWRPDQITSPGFQLSFGVVLGLIHLQPLLRERWFGKADMEVASSAQMIGQWLLGSLATAAAAWLIATPIVLYHFGIISPMGIPLSVIGVPVVALLLALGYAKLLLGWLLPSVAILLGVPLAIVADLMTSLVLSIDALPGTTIHTPYASATWTFVALAFVCWWATRQFAPRWVLTFAGVAVLVVWLYWPLLVQQRSALRVDMLAVGDGSCLILRSGGKTFVFDAGSNSSLDAGRRWIVPAMRRLNVRTIDAIAISHPDIDHYSAVLEVIDAFNVKRVLVTPQLLEQVQAWPDSPVAFMAEGLGRRRIVMEPVTAGFTMQLGNTSLSWLHPESTTESYGRDNDHSMVIQADAAGRRVLLTGDLEREGIARLLPREATIRADIVELPHHGSYNDMAVALMRQLQPQIVLQSTGYTRWQRDRWAQELAGTQRYVTVRDGAAWVEIAHDGTMTSGSFIE